MKKLLYISGIIFFIYGSCLCVFTNLNLGVVLVVLIGLFLLCYGAFYEKTNKGILKYIKITALCLFVFEFLIVSFLGLYGGIDNVDYKEDAVVVLGAGIRGDKVTLPLKFRLDKAIEYHHKNLRH